jgi:hypothetical protein
MNQYDTDRSGLMTMARPPGAKNKPKGASAKSAPKTEGLLAALEFVGVAATKDVLDYQKHVVLLGNMAIMFDGQIAAGHPIVEDLSCCPHYDKLVVALRKAGGAVAITETDTQRLSIKGDKLRALVPCLTGFAAAMPYSAPDAPCATIDDRLKAAL